MFLQRLRIGTELRKAASRRLAEAGCSANEIAAITRHATLKEVSRYTKEAEQERLARAAIARLHRGRMSEKIPNSELKFGKLGKKSSKISGNFKIWRTGQDSNPRPPDS
jgi:hypothetical protein